MTVIIPNTFVSGTPAQAAQVNQNFSTVATAIDASLPRDGSAAMLAPLRLVLGSAAVPALTFDGDTDLGIYRKAANTLGFSAGGAEIGSWSATALTVVPTLTLTVPLALTSGGTGATTAPAAATALGLGTGDSPQFTALNVGNDSDTTLTRVSAGVLAVEGVTLLTTATGQAVNAILTAFAGLTLGTNQMFYVDAAGAILLSTLSAFSRGLLDNGTQGSWQTDLGLGTGNSPQFAGINVGAPTDTTITRVSAGLIAVEGSNVLMASNVGTIVLGVGAAQLPVGWSGLMEYTNTTALNNLDSTSGANVKTPVAHGSGFTAGAGTTQTGMWINESGTILDANGAEQYGQMRRTA